MSEVFGIPSAFLRGALRAEITCNLPGRLRLAYPAYRMLPEGAEPYLHYIGDAVGLLRGVKTVEYNARIGTLLIRYDSSLLSSGDVLAWMDTLVEEGICLAGSMERSGRTFSEQDIVRLATGRLQARLRQPQRRSEGA
mgnify:CR=1 FL=1